MSGSLEQVVAFTKENFTSLKNETLTSLNYEFIIKVNEIDRSGLRDISNLEGVKIVFEYRGDLSSAKDIQEFKMSFGNEHSYKEVEENVIVKIRINKSVFNKNDKYDNFYLFSSLSILKQKFFGFVNNFKWENEKKKFYITLLENEDGLDYSNDFIYILSLEKSLEIEEEMINQKSMNKYKTYKALNENGTIQGLLTYPLSWMDINGETPSIFIQHGLNLFFESIANDNYDSNVQLIKGYKNVYFCKKLEYDKGTSSENSKYSFKLIDFLIDEDKYMDKLLMVRNSITLYLDTNSSIQDFLSKSKDIYRTVDHNFDLYIQNEIKVFLEQKNALFHEYIRVSRQLGELTNDLSKQMRTIGISLLGSVFLGITSNLNTDISVGTLNFVLLSYSIFYILNFGITFSHSKQFEDTKELLKSYTSTIAANNKALSFEELRIDYLDGPSDNFKWVLLSIRLLLGVLILIFIGTYLSINFGLLSFITDFLKILLH